MKFFNNRIFTKNPMTLAEAATVKPPAFRSLDQMLSDMNAAKAAPQTVVKTASVAAPAAAKAPVATKTAAAQPEKAAAASRTAESDVIEITSETDVRKLIGEAPAAAPARTASKDIQIKIAKQMDFREWEAEDIVKAWGQHGGDVRTCIKNVTAFKGSDNPEVYCGLMQVAANMAAAKLTRTAAAGKAGKAAKTASRSFVKISKLDDKSRAMLEKYFTMIYGKDYVESLLADY